MFGTGCSPVQAPTRDYPRSGASQKFYRHPFALGELELTPSSPRPGTLNVLLRAPSYRLVA